jgi:hypothetical protein
MQPYYKVLSLTINNQAGILIRNFALITVIIAEKCKENV